MSPSEKLTQIDSFVAATVMNETTAKLKQLIYQLKKQGIKFKKESDERDPEINIIASNFSDKTALPLPFPQEGLTFRNLTAVGFVQPGVDIGISLTKPITWLDWLETISNTRAQNALRALQLKAHFFEITCSTRGNYSFTAETSLPNQNVTPVNVELFLKYTNRFNQILLFAGSKRIEKTTNFEESINPLDKIQLTSWLLTVVLRNLNGVESND